MSIRTTLAVGALVTLLLGCVSPDLRQIQHDGTQPHADSNEVPIASNFPTSMQRKLQAAEHWKSVANYSASELSNSLQRASTCSIGLQCKTLVIRRSCETTGCTQVACETTFGKVFHEELVTAMVNLGYRVSTVPVKDGITLEYDVQTVSFGPNRPQYRHAGRAVELADGVWALKDPAAVVNSQESLLKPNSGERLNWYRTEFATGRTPTREIVVTASAKSADQAYIGRSTEVYYISDADVGHYVCERPVADPCQENCSTKVFDQKSWTIGVQGDCSEPRCKAPARKTCCN